MASSGTAANGETAANSEWRVANGGTAVNGKTAVTGDWQTVNKWERCGRARLCRAKNGNEWRVANGGKAASGEWRVVNKRYGLKTRTRNPQLRTQN
ncbi:hypothetical protein Q2T83_01135 [Fervidibacter sacchari]|uniref:Uncharacterized protein n=1 Tax=Candidatus Fervidibacter sacchari TaxID=1448929 RepID=A0ABT2EUS8_9BACT|nr:hypothetical protein [Candidatus Fervidibacter sacchari]MCS3921206.1 hypothetical protein [Candidatus Fervidibacter sacchari]WKU16452.1 hypothetical protein Q2T83_01135 [Candidatus Fervidibacter sacchari]